MHPLPPVSEQRILAVYAHPDDECYCSGGTLAKYSDEGAEIMVVAATKGDAGQINDTYRATRHTLGEVRASELRASCETLGVKHVECWDYPDGGLASANRQQLVGDIVSVIRRFRPHIVITFGPDGGYGHPDHIAISDATTQAVALACDPDTYPEQLTHTTPHEVQRLYHAYFPERRTLLLEELATWLMQQKERFKGTLDFIQALSIFAEEATLLHYSSDFVSTRWYPPGFCIIEQGERPDNLYIILSGTVNIVREHPDGTLEHLAERSVGEFVGEIGVATHNQRNAHVIAKTATTCLIFSPGEPTHFAGRGEGAVLGGMTTQRSHQEQTGMATHMIDVRDYVMRKITAIGCHRTQFPITSEMFPLDMLQRLFGYEYFIRIYPEYELETTL
jgi:LmbE family N-acetylglucosaminyl deacetylase